MACFEMRGLRTKVRNSSHLACAPSVSVGFSIIWPREKMEREGGGGGGGKEMPIQKISFFSLFLLRKPTETLATQGSCHLVILIYLLF